MIFKNFNKGNIFSIVPFIFAIKETPAVNWQLGFQTPASPTMEGIISFHDDLMIFLSFILGFVMYILWVCLTHFTKEIKKNEESDKIVHASTLEIIWTIIPAIILIIIAIPSFSLLYSVDEEVVDAFATFKVIGHQWYWSYHWTTPNLAKNFVFEEDAQNEEGLNEWSSFYDSYMLSDEELGELLEKKKRKESPITPYRLLTVDRFIYLPIQKNIRVLVSSADVLHSWAVPSLGVKVDACPGRLNRTSVYIKKPGIFYGQCSEICGVNHGFMPIGIYGFFYGLRNESSFQMMQSIDWDLILSAVQQWED